MNIFITGASGFIGEALIQKLKANHTIYGMARSDIASNKVKISGGIPIRCELNNVQKEHLKDIDLVIHAAAMVSDWGAKKEFYQSNVEGTRQLLEIAKEASIKRFIHISTETVLFYGQDMINVDETYPYPKKSPYLYAETKKEAEKLVIDANETGVLETIIIRPKMVWGPGDKTILPNILEMIDSGSFIWINNGTPKTSSTNIHNLVHGIDLAISKAKAGEIYFITDAEINTYKDFISMLLKTQDIIPKDKVVKAGLLRTFAIIIEGIWKLFNIKKAPPITRFPIDMMAAEMTININKAKTELGYKPVISVEEGMDELMKMD